MMWLQWLKKELDIPLTAERKTDLEAVFSESLYGFSVKMGIAILCFQAFMMASSFLRGGWLASPRRITYLLLYGNLFCLTALFLFVLIRLRNGAAGSVSWQINLSVFYSCFLCAWSCMITLLDQHTGTNVSVYSYVLMSVALFSLLRPWQSIALFSGAFCLLNGLANAQQHNPLFFREALNAHNLFINSLFVTLLSIIGSITLYRYRILNRRDRALIQEQYDQIRSINQQLNDLAMTDHLTGVGNRRFLNENLQQQAHELMGNPHTVTGMLLDIDYFKQYNDNHGHQAGDLCLIRIADVMRRFAQREGAFVARYGGEEFFLYLADCTDPLARAEALRREIVAQRLARSDLPGGCVTVSIGVDVEENWPAIGQDAFLRRCDQALYKAKNEGRNRVCLYQPQ